MHLDASAMLDLIYVSLERIHERGAARCFLDEGEKPADVHRRMKGEYEDKCIASAAI